MTGKDANGRRHVSERKRIRMTINEIDTFLGEESIVTCATLGRSGRPHLLPLWYVPQPSARLDCWTYASSQKVLNLRALPQATVQVEAGESYEQLRGVSMECDVEITDDARDVAAIGLALTVRYTDELTMDAVPDGVREFVSAQAGKRVGLRFNPTRIVSWDHRKLAGVH